MQLNSRSNESGYLRMFKFYGLDLVQSNQQVVGDCPFCQKENHFFANPGTGLWDCKVCGAKGNNYEFIRQFHQFCLDGTTEADYKSLSEVRSGISVPTLRAHKLAYNPLLDEWLLPSYNLKGNMSNLYAWKQQSTLDGPVMTVMSGPVFKQIMYGLQHYRKDRSRPLWVLEGHWDLLAFYDALLYADQLNEHDFMAVPGAQTFPEEDVPLMSMRDVRLIYDKDAAGEKGILTAIQKMGRYAITPSILQRIGWGKVKEGYDLRDFKQELEATVRKALPPFKRSSQEVVAIDLPAALEMKLSKMDVDFKKAANENYNAKAKMVPCNSFEDLCDSVASKLELPDYLRDVLAIVSSIVATTNVFEKPLWNYLVGRAGTGKTTIVDLFSTASEYTFGISKMTGVLSGYFREGMGDASLVNHFQGKCVIIKDFTTILRMSPQVQDTIFGELRDMYDGSTAAFYRNHIKRVFKGIRFNMIACVTDVIRSQNNTDVGERFLCTEYDSYWSPDGHLTTNSMDDKAMTRRAVTNVLMKIGKADNTDGLLAEQRGHAWGFINHVVNRINDDPKWIQSKVMSVLENEPIISYIENLAFWTANARSGVQRDKEKQILYRPKVESEKRLAEQLSKQAIALCLILDEYADSDAVKSCLRKLALDTGYGFQQEIMLNICHNNLRQAQVGSLARELNLGQTSILNRLRDMQELNIVGYHTPSVASRGNQPHIYTLSPRVKECAESLGFYTPLKD